MVKAESMAPAGLDTRPSESPSRRFSRSLPPSRCLRTRDYDERSSGGLGQRRRNENRNLGGKRLQPRDDDEDEGDDSDDELGRGGNVPNLQAPTQVVPAPAPQIITPEPQTVTMDPITVTREPTTITMDPSTIVVVSTIITSSADLTLTVTASTLFTRTDVLDSISTQPPRKGLDELDSSLGTNPTPPTSAAGTSSVTTGTALANNTPSSETSDKDDDVEDLGLDGTQDDKGNEDRTRENVLIGAVSIGVFIAICMLVWFGWRLMKRRGRKSKRRSSSFDVSGGKFSEKILGQFPWLQRGRKRGWEALGDDGDTGAGVAVRQRASMTSSAGTTAAPGPVTGYQEAAKQSVILMPGVTGFSGRVRKAAQSFGGSSAKGHAGNDANTTIRSKVAGTFDDQFEVGHEAPEENNTEYKQLSRISGLSSLSSGFGDGDIIVQPTFLQLPPPSVPSLRQSNNLVGRCSWQSWTNRETVYTETSEDSPARFRSIGSWVGQQTGRVRRAQKRAENGEASVPPVPDLPGVPGIPLATGMPEEPQYSMMMDFEAPKLPVKQE